MTIVCSNWADNFPSAVTTVHPSFSTRVSKLPWFTMGSIVRAIPGRNTMPRDDCR